MLAASGASATISWDSLPLFDRVYGYSHDGCRPGRTFEIVEWAGDFVSCHGLDPLTRDDRMGILCDPQTSGGLLVAVAPENVSVFMETFESIARRKPTRIGEITDGPAGIISVE